MSTSLSRLSAERFWSRISKGESCWEWTGARSSNGYGSLRTAQRTYSTHRLAWILANGPIPDGLCVCHRCDNPPCCNPAHLFLGTARENAADKVDKGRARGGGQRGEGHPCHKLTAAQVEEIRSRLAAGESHRSIGRSFGVWGATIGRIAIGRSWTTAAHVSTAADRAIAAAEAQS